MRRKARGIKANQRFAFILFVFMVILTVLFGRVLYWKVVHGAEFEAAAKNQQINRYDLVNAANRGSILDRNEQVLAVSTAVYNVVLDPLQLAEEDDAKKTKKTFDTLCEYFPDLNYEDLEYHITKNQETGKINTPTHWKYLVKGVERSVKEELEKKKLLGVYFEQSSKRSYPLKTLACHLIGFNNTWGLEGYYNDEMTGTPGRSFILYQGADKVTYQDYEAQDGNTIVTTLDYNIQQYAEQAVKETMEAWPSENVAAIVMNPNTGEIYAMASADTFDLNDPDEPTALATDETFKETWDAMTDQEKSDYLNTIWRNFCVSDTYEPGSIYKPLVVAAALEEGVITKNSTFNCSGKITVGDRDINCHLHSGHGTLSVEEIMAQSCNPGVIQIAQKLGAEKFYKYQKEFGFGQKTGIDLPGELQGYVASQTTLYDKNKAISASEQSTWRPSIVFNNIKKHLIEVGEDYNMTFDEEKLNKCVKRLMDMAVDYNQGDWLPEIRTILMEELDMPRELVYLQIVAGDTFIMLNEIKWGGSEAIMAAVGQSITTVTPVAMARYVAAVANGGKVYDLRLIDSIISPDGEVLSESTPILASEIEGEGVAEYLAALRKGMHGVAGDDGTATKFFRDAEYDDVRNNMGAKTGTAEKTTIDLENNAWMVAFAPYENPEIAVCVYIPHGYSGSYCSVTIREVLNYYLEHRTLDGEDMMAPSNSLAY